MTTESNHPASARLLEGKHAIIYGAGGLIGREVARTFAREGAALYLAGRTTATLQVVADGIIAGGGHAHVAVVDTLDERAVEEHVQAVVEQSGGIDISFNLTTRGDVQGTRLLDMEIADFLRPIETGIRSNFITARAAARRMVQRGSGVILMLTSGSGAAHAALPPEAWPMGGTGPADAATETFMRYLAAEVGPRGVRAVSLWTAAVSDTLAPAVAESDDRIEAVKNDLVGAAAMLRRRPSVREVADTAAFLASDRASGITAATVSVMCGLAVH